MKAYDNVHGLSNYNTIDTHITRKVEDNPRNTIMFTELSTEQIHPIDYLVSVERYLPNQLISSENFSKIKSFAGNFSEGITSFFGFETKLGDTNTISDYMFAVSSKKGEREALVSFIEGGGLNKRFTYESELKRVKDFAYHWADPNSIIYNKVLGLWLEFDAEDITKDILIPNIFIQLKKTRIDNEKDLQEFKWVTKTALPMLTGESLPEKIENNLINAIKHLPENTSVYQIGTMLSRNNNGVRIVINKVKPEQVIPYLKSIGFKFDLDGLNDLISELDKYVTRIVLNINIGDTVDPNIGIECSFSKNRFHMETGWSNFLEYLVEKGICTPEKKDALLGFTGIEHEEDEEDFDLQTYMVAPRLPDKDYTSALVRYISHVKLVYKPDNKIEAKAYPGIRLFGNPL